MRRKQLVDRLVYFAVRVFIAIVQATRIETCQHIARWIAALVTDVVRLRGKVVDENLRHTFPELSESQRRRITRAMWEHLLLMVCEIAHAPRKIHRNNWHRHVSLPQRRQWVQRLLDDRPVVVVAGHFGNFEIGSYVVAMLGFPTVAVARPLDNPYLHDYLMRFRGGTGQYMLPKDGSAAQIQDVLDSGGTLMLLGDQNAGTKGHWIDFLGRPASCHKAIALFSLSSGAPLLVAATPRTSGPMHFTASLLGLFDPREGDPTLADVGRLTRWYNACLERAIRDAPEQYWWLHRRWKDPPARVLKRLQRQAA